MWLILYLPVNTLILLSILCFWMYKYVSRNFDHWAKKKVDYIKPIPFFGNFMDIFLFRTNIGEYLAKLYNQTKEPFLGIFVFDTPHLIIRSPELVKAILVKDFNNFDDRNIAVAPHEPMVSDMLLISRNPEWKILRTKLTPVFTSQKLKGMIPLINEVGKNMKKYIDQNMSHSSLETTDICLKYTTDVMASCAFAINANCFQNEDAEFRKIAKLNTDFRWFTAMQQTSYFFLPQFVNIFKLKFVDPKVTNFLREAVWNVIKLREQELHTKNDMINVIIDMMKDKEFCKNNNFEGDKVVAQAAEFFMAGSETISAVMTFTLYELCLHPRIQNELKSEIKSCIEENGGITYEAIQSMKYLHMCVCETLRKYPFLPFLDRKTKFDYKLPGNDVVIEKGTPVLIPIFSLHYDAEYFPLPHQYNPERFSEENCHKLTPFSYIPFGEGPRNCIGKRMGLLCSKLGLVHILSEFAVEKALSSPIPIEFEPKSFLLYSKVGLPMKFRKNVASAE